MNFKVLSFLSENDKIFQPSLEKFNLLVSKKHTIKFIPEANHAYPLNQPKLTAKLIYDFIRSLSWKQNQKLNNLLIKVREIMKVIPIFKG